MHDNDTVAPKRGDDSYLVSRGTDDAADIEIFTLQWGQDQPRVEGEDTGALIYCRVFVNGVEVPRILSARVNAAGDFMTVDLQIAPSDVKVTPVNLDLWNAMGGNA